MLIRLEQLTERLMFTAAFCNQLITSFALLHELSQLSYSLFKSVLSRNILLTGFWAYHLTHLLILRISGPRMLVESPPSSLKILFLA